jgi:hypothetical protein
MGISSATLRGALLPVNPSSAVRAPLPICPGKSRQAMTSGSFPNANFLGHCFFSTNDDRSEAI